MNKAWGLRHLRPVPVRLHAGRQYQKPSLLELLIYLLAQSGARSAAANPGRPVPCYEPADRSHPAPSLFPESIAEIPTCEIDKSIPDPTSQTLTRDEAQMLGFLDQQAKVEKSICRRYEEDMLGQDFPDPATDCHAPSVCQEFQTARLFLSHLGFLWDDVTKVASTGNGQPLMALNQNQTGFYSALDSLDRIPSRTNDTVFVFYVKEGQVTPLEILGNVTSSRNVHPMFLEFLRSLGWPVDVGMHTGWTGNVATSWRVTSGDFNIADLPADHGGSLYSGHHQVLYWSDVLSELVFVVPSPKNLPRDVASGEVTLRPKADSFPERSTTTMMGPPAYDGMAASAEVPQEKVQRAMSLNIDSTETVTRPARSRPARMPNVALAELKVLVVWLESFEDHVCFPLSELLPATNTGQETPSGRGDVFVIFVHALQSGLFRIKVQSRGTKRCHSVDGMVVSRRVLGILIRQTALNICRRRRLEAEM
ncbi:hypothetical protein HPB51_023986 [Rhipicephalus microplus]|uniref:Rap-GAP domain-containing protein n=1 Tax=Rhipicephalus microplus TaxID=6941 RepID=A0A9J6ED09_RHIMP|nr:hypothetical protein HPB51_023986 [Rhipicephalus microplus]